MCSCTSESYFEEINENSVESHANKVSFDAHEENYQTFLAATKSIVEVHREMENFREVLSEKQVAFLDGEKFNVDEAVAIIFLWWENEELHDVLVEWPDFDDFFIYLPEKYWAQSPIFW